MEPHSKGYLALILHAHLPYVRHPEHQESLEENWLYEAITETYVPLFLVLEGLIQDGIDFRLTFSVSPTLSSMLGDPFLQSRYLRRLERLMELAESEVARTRSQPQFHELALMYRAHFARVHDAFVNRYHRDLLSGLRHFQELGKVELIASAATHGYLPLLSVTETAVRAQIRLGLEHHQRSFGNRAKGFWLPECGYYPGLDYLLQEQAVRFTILETHGATRADERLRYGVHAPVYCPSGVAAFARDPDSSRQVWSSIEGYPGDFDYREFYRDIGHDLDFDYIRPYLHPIGIRCDTGIKYYRITGKDGAKEPYVPEWAEGKAASHARHFLAARIAQIEQLTGMIDRKPLVVAPYDAELFGHWWFEGPRWLDHLIRMIALEQNTVGLATLTEYLDEYPVNQTATPSMSSWGSKGFNEVWNNQRNQWIYPHLHMAAEFMEDLAITHAAADGLTRRAVNQAARELLLAQSSDWAFMMHSGTTDQYARARIERHISRFHELRKKIEHGTIDPAWLAQLESQDNIFPEINACREFRNHEVPALEAKSTAPAVAAPRLAVLREDASTLSMAARHIVMVCPEVVPLAKTGGLADMVGSLADALERLGQRVSLIMPAYRRALGNGTAIHDTGIRIAVAMPGRTEEAQLLSATIGSKVRVYLVRADRYFDREHLYGAPDGDYLDNAERFAFFGHAVLQALREIDPPDVLHAHDWQTALPIALLKCHPERYPGLSSVRTVFTVHNLGYQGRFSPYEWDWLGIDRAFFCDQALEFYGDINLLKGGLVFADAVTTVSPTYSQEIRTPKHGFGLEGVLQQRAARVVGILNGVDYNVWNPVTDPLIAQHYGPGDLAGKCLCKEDLQRTFGLPQQSCIPLLGIVSRLASQKGLDLVEAILDELLTMDIQLVVLGSGDRHYQDYFRSAALRHAGKLAVRIGFDEALAHKIEAGADMFLMPSRYEPCGLNQLYSLKYGTIPIVRATGGLKDSVQEFDPVFGTGNGFVFDAYSGPALQAAVNRALAAFSKKDEWAILMRNAMAADHSWKYSASEYLALYHTLLG